MTDLDKLIKSLRGDREIELRAVLDQNENASQTIATYYDMEIQKVKYVAGLAHAYNTSY